MIAARLYAQGPFCDTSPAPNRTNPTSVALLKGGARAVSGLTRGGLSDGRRRRRRRRARPEVRIIVDHVSTGDQDDDRHDNDPDHGRRTRRTDARVVVLRHRQSFVVWLGAGAFGRSPP